MKGAVNMSLDLAMILTGGLVVLGSIGMASFVIWLRFRDKESKPDIR
jgi:hypothetical protein